LNRNAPTPTERIKDVGLPGKVINYVTRRNKPEILTLKVADRLGDGKKPMVSSKSTQPDEHTISRTQANTALRNAQALERRKRGTVRNSSGSKRSFVGSEVKVPLTVPR
jgi:DNA polymerase III sliding clamp (beta) subunit (PCNA family)